MLNPENLAPVTVTDAIARRRSIRSYTTEPIAESTVRALVHAAVHAPTAMHNEPWLFAIVQDPVALRRYSDVAKATLIEEAHVYQNLHYPALKSKNGDFLKALQRPDFNIFYDAGTLIVICAAISNAFTTADCWLAAENLMLAAVGMGLGTCCVGSALPALNAQTVKTELGIPSDVSAIAAIVVGVPAEAPLPSGRKVPTFLGWKKGAA